MTAELDMAYDKIDSLESELGEVNDKLTELTGKIEDAYRAI